MSNVALITGSTSGIGKEFVNILASNKYDIVLVSRNKEKLERQANELVNKYGINTYVIVCDLEQDNASKYVYEYTNKLDLKIDLLINNAGFSEYGYFNETDINKEIGMINLLIKLPTELMKLYLPNMIANNNGRILNIASIASFVPSPKLAVYAASKAYLLSTSQAINCELKGTNVSITSLCPGATISEFANKSGMNNTFLFKHFVMKADKVAKIGYKALMKGKETKIPGLYNKLIVLSSILLPRKFISFITKKML